MLFVFKVLLHYESTRLIFSLWNPTDRCKKSKHSSGFKNSNVLKLGRQVLKHRKTEISRFYLKQNFLRAKATSNIPLRTAIKCFPEILTSLSPLPSAFLWVKRTHKDKRKNKSILCPKDDSYSRSLIQKKLVFTKLLDF